MDLEINSLKCWARKRSRPPAEPALKLQIARATTAHETDNISEELGRVYFSAHRLLIDVGLQVMT